MPTERVAAIYDIHGNLPALEAVLKEIREVGVDRIVVGGDVVPGPMPRETVAALQGLSLPVSFLRGNGDRNVVAAARGGDVDPMPEPAQEAVRWVARELAGEKLEVLARWPLTLRQEITGLGEVLFCHATPRNDTEIFTPATSEDHLRPIFEATGVPVVVCGHTHVQFELRVGDVRVINAGSVGMPFGDPGAYWALVSADGVMLQRTHYDLDAAAERLRATGYPGRFEIQNPPSAEEMLKAFQAVALR